MNPPRRILIVRTDRLGDVILTLPMARAIKIAMPDAHIGFYCREYTRSIVERSPDIDEVVVQSDMPSIAEHVRTLRGWDAVFFPNARPDLALAGFLARVRTRIGTGFRYYSLLYTNRINEHRKTAERNEAEHNLRMLRAIGIEAPTSLLPAIVLRFAEINEVEEWKRQHGLSTEYVVLHIGSGGSSHAWPIEYWMSLASGLRDRYNIVLTGSESERESLEAVQAKLIANATPTTLLIGHTLPELAALLAGANSVISGSTGPGHLAAVLGTKAVGLFPLPLPLSKERWGFRGRRAVNLSPPALSTCPNCEMCDCMSRLTPQAVLSTIS